MHHQTLKKSLTKNLRGSGATPKTICARTHKLFTYRKPLALSLLTDIANRVSDYFSSCYYLKTTGEKSYVRKRHLLTTRLPMMQFLSTLFLAFDTAFYQRLLQKKNCQQNINSKLISCKSSFLTNRLQSVSRQHLHLIPSQ